MIENFSPRRVYLEYNGSGSNKFYELLTDNCEVTIRYGKIGSDGVISVKKFKSYGETKSFVLKTKNEKLKKGYIDHSEKREEEKLEHVLKISLDEIRPQSETRCIDTFNLECMEADVCKFFGMFWDKSVVTSKYGIKGTIGTSTVKQFANAMDAHKYVDKTLADKLRQGYHEKPPSISSSSTASVAVVSNNTNRLETKTVKDDPEEQLEDLENGLKVFIQGSSALPYTCKKFDGGYSCTCQGWTMNVKNKGVQATSCKHLRSIRGNEAESLRCEDSSGVCNPSGKAQRSNDIAAKIALAHAWKQSTDPTGYVMSEKLDGMRAYWTGTQLFTRSGLAIIYPDWFTAAFPTDLELDGELFVGRKMFEQCMSITRRTDKGGDWTRVSYVVFDAPTVAGGIQTRLETALAAIKRAEEGRQQEEKAAIRVHPFELCGGLQHVLEALTAIESIGGEGLMLRHPTARHRAGRTSDLLKVKSFQDDEALVTGYEQGKGKYAGMVGALVCVTRSGAAFKVGSGLVDSQRNYSNAPQVGSVITFKYFELSNDGIPRFPTFMRIRTDVDASDFPHS